MKWFKHISDSLDDPFIFELLDKFGGDGYLVFFGTLEIISREFDINAPGTCSVPHRFLTKKLQLSRQKVVKILRFCNENNRIFFKENGSRFSLNCPKLKGLCDEWTKKQLRSKYGVTPLKLPIEEEVRSKKKTYVEGSDELRLSELLFDTIQRRKPDFKKPNLQTWAKHIDLMIRVDARDPHGVEEVIKWTQLNDFWQNNILSTLKLRQQFDQLELKMQQDTGYGSELTDEDIEKMGGFTLGEG